MDHKITSFIPPKIRLMGAAPSSVDERVLKALSRPVISHLDPYFIAMMKEIQFFIRYIFETKNDLTFPLSGPASSAMEACFLNVIEENDKVIVCENGLYGERMGDLLRVYGAKVIPISHKWGEAIDIHRVEETLKKNPDAKALCAVHGESSTGVLSDIESIGRLCHAHGVLSIIDAVSSIVSSPLKIDDWGIDIAYANTHKCLGGMPGLAPITVSDRAIDVILKRKTPVRSYFLNFIQIMNNWYKQDKILRTYHFSAPVNSLYGMHEALLMIYEEGLEALRNRYAENGRRLSQGLENMELEMPVPADIRIPILNLVKVQPDWDQSQIIQQLYHDHGVQISAGLGKNTPDFLRIAPMGKCNNTIDIDYTLAALKIVLKK